MYKIAGFPDVKRRGVQHEQLLASEFLCARSGAVGCAQAKLCSAGFHWRSPQLVRTNLRRKPPAHLPCTCAIMRLGAGAARPAPSADRRHCRCCAAAWLAGGAVHQAGPHPRDQPQGGGEVGGAAGGCAARWVPDLGQCMGGSCWRCLGSRVGPQAAASCLTPASGAFARACSELGPQPPAAPPAPSRPSLQLLSLRFKLIFYSQAPTLTWCTTALRACPPGARRRACSSAAAAAS
jgi:hypothetical protein